MYYSYVKSFTYKIESKNILSSNNYYTKNSVIGTSVVENLGYLTNNSNVIIIIIKCVAYRLQEIMKVFIDIFITYPKYRK